MGKCNKMPSKMGFRARLNARLNSSLKARSNERQVSKAARQMGFTLIEILVVVVIIAILAAFVAPMVMKKPEEARIARAKQDIGVISNAMDMYKLDNDLYPSQEQGIKALVTKPTVGQVPDTWQPYLKRLPVDPWSHPYRYQNPGKHGEIDIYSDGPPHATGSPAKVIGNWQQ